MPSILIFMNNTWKDFHAKTSSLGFRENKHHESIEEVISSFFSSYCLLYPSPFVLCFSAHLVSFFCLDSPKQLLPYTIFCHLFDLKHAAASPFKFFYFTILFIWVLGLNICMFTMCFLHPHGILNCSSDSLH